MPLTDLMPIPTSNNSKEQQQAPIIRYVNFESFPLGFILMLQELKLGSLCTKEKGK